MTQDPKNSLSVRPYLLGEDISIDFIELVKARIELLEESISEVEHRAGQQIAANRAVIQELKALISLPDNKSEPKEEVSLQR